MQRFEFSDLFGKHTTDKVNSYSKTKATKQTYICVLWTFVWHNSPTYGLMLFYTSAPYEFNKPKEHFSYDKTANKNQKRHDRFDEYFSTYVTMMKGKKTEVGYVQNKNLVLQREGEDTWQTTSVKTSFDGLQDSKWIFLKDRLLI